MNGTMVEEELKAIAAEGAFGKDCGLVSFVEDRGTCAKDQFMSSVMFGTAITSDGSHHRIVVKSKLGDRVLRESCKSDLLFNNEIAMYEKILPFLLACRGPWESDVNRSSLSLPRYFYGRNRCGEFAEKDIIVLENVSPLGYRLCEDRLFLDYDHYANALQALAKFHGLSYAAKHKDPAGFREAVALVKDTQWDADGRWLIRNDALRKLGKRGVDRLMEQGHRDDDGHLRRFIGLIEDGENSLRRALRPREPLAVLCHGDFCRNNVMFRYDGGRRPVDALPLDFGTPRYGSPALDVSFFVYLNSTRLLRECRLDELLDVYCAALAAAVPTGVRVPGRAELDAEMAASALFGFAHASFFLPYQSRGHDEDEFDLDYTSDELIDRLLAAGGDRGTEQVADMVRHFVRMGYTAV